MIDPFNNASCEAAGRPSLQVKQSVDDDVLKILKSSDETTWFTLDVIIKKLDEHTKKLGSLLFFNTNIDKIVSPSERNLDMVSPLVEAIRETSVISIDNDSLVESNHHTVCSVSTGNPDNMEKHKEAMTQQNINKNVPESLKNTQKRQMPIPLVIGPGIGHDELINESYNKDATTTLTQEALNALSMLDSLNTSGNLPTESGPNTSHNFSTEPLKYDLYITNFSNRTTCEDVKGYISRFGECDLNKMKIIRLTKKDQDISLLSYVSFKIETDSEMEKQLMEPGFWPIHCTAQKFVDKGKPVSKHPAVAVI